MSPIPLFPLPPPPQGLRACDAVDSLVDASAIDTLLSNFIVPLQSDDISKPDANGEGAGRGAARWELGGTLCWFDWAPSSYCGVE